jgi:hypothetical protein
MSVHGISQFLQYDTDTSFLILSNSSFTYPTIRRYKLGDAEIVAQYE